MINRRSRSVARARAGTPPHHPRQPAPAPGAAAPPQPSPAPPTSPSPQDSARQEAPTSPIAILGSGAAGLWHGPVVRVTREALARALHSWLLAGEVVAVGAIFVVCYSASVTTRGFFDAAGLWLALLGVAGSAALVTSVWPAAHSARFVPHRDYRAMAAGLVLAAVALQWAAALLLMALALLFGRVTPLDAGAFAAGAIGLLANLALLCTVTVVLLPPFGAQLLRLGFLAWLALALYSYTAGALGVAGIARLPLLPFGAAFAFGQTGRIGAVGALALVVELAFIAALIAIAGIIVPRRKRLRM